MSILFQRKDLRRDPKYKKYHKEIKIKAKEVARVETNNLIKRRLERKQRQNDLLRDVISESQNVTSDETYDKIGDSGTKVLIDDPNDRYLSLDQFFARPVLLDNYFLARGAKTARFINPWELWSTDNTVLSKLSNYAFFRGDMNVRIIVSSTKFHYGNILISYQPKHTLNAVLTLYTDMLADDAGVSKEVTNNYLSQSAETAIIRVGKDNSIEMKLPFIHHQPHARLFNEDGLVVNSTNGFDDFADMGRLYLSCLNEIQCSNTDFTPVHIQIYGWVSDISLGSITATDVNVTGESQFINFLDVVSESDSKPKAKDKGKRVAFTQSNSKKSDKNRKVINKKNSPNFEGVRKSVVNNGIVKDISNYASQYADDEYADAGPVTKIASALSNISNKVANVPFIGGLATATSIASGYAASVANFFGFSKPANINPVELTKVLTFSNMANFSGKETNVKLSGDPKCELAITPLGGEYQADPMSITFMSSRESYLMTFPWTTADTVGNDDLVVLPVSPQLRSKLVAEKDIYQPTAMCFAADLFKFWRGTITFRFEVASSQFHRGRLMFIYEPNPFNFSLTSAKPTNFNQQFIAILDLDTDDSITLDVEYCSERSFTPTAQDQILNNGTHTQGNIYSGNFLTLTQFGFCAGYISVRVLNSLMTNNFVDGTSVDVNVYAYSEDLELAVPADVVIAPKSAVISESADLNSTQSVGSPSVHHTLNQGSTSSDDIYLYHFGERITSFRSYLKKFTVYFDTTIDPGSNRFHLQSDIYGGVIPADVPQYNNVVTVMNSENTLSSSNLHNTFNYLRFGYLFMKGGMRYKFNVRDVTTARITVSNRVIQFIGTTGFGLFKIDNLYSPRFNTYIHVFDDTSAEFECPYLSNSLFTYSQYVNFNQDGLVTGYHGPIFDLICQYNGTGVKEFTAYQAVSDDFTFFRFQGGAPRVLPPGL